MPNRDSWKSYYRRVFSRALADARGNITGAVVTVLCGIAASILRARWGLLQPNQLWLTAVATALPVVISLLLFFLFFVVRAPWKIHNDIQAQKDGELKTAENEKDERIRQLGKDLEKLSADLDAERDRNQKPEIRIEIIEGFFNWGPFEGASPDAEGTGWGPRLSELFITLYLRLVNLRQARGSITDCALAIQTKEGATYDLHSERVVLPKPHIIERDTAFHRSHSGLSRTTTETIPDLDLPATLERGVPAEGLVQFVINDCRKQTDDTFQDNATFKLVVTDSFLGTHEFTRPPKTWEKTGRLAPKKPIGIV